MAHTKVHTLDLEFQGLKGAIAAYLIPHSGGAALVESGPGSTLPGLEKALAQHNYTFQDITDVFLTHIHLDHAGAAGWLAQQGARIHVHRVGAPHLVNPEKLLSSAQRIYGDMMDVLWGEFLPVPEERLSVLDDQAQVQVNGVCVQAIDTPGHASHHFAYLMDDICFSGDIGGVRLGGLKHLRLPMPPPELNFEQWRHSLDRLQKLYQQKKFTRIAPTHFGIYEDVEWHLVQLVEELQEAEDWMNRVMPADPEIEELRNEFTRWTNEVSTRKGLDVNMLTVQEAANPSFMSADGIHRYWKKFRANR